MKMRDLLNQVCDFREKEVEKQEFFSKKELIAYENRGLVKGPDESEKEFFKRVHQTLSHPFPEQALKRFESLFQMRPDWVPLLIQKKPLKLWEAAATWIEDDSVTIQLKSLTPPPSYSLEEILSHELVHAVRLKFQEPLFEEILAFRTSKNRLRRFLGPLFSRPIDTYLFLTSLCLSWIGYCVGYSIDSEWLCLFSWAFPLVFFLTLLTKLTYLQIIFHRAQAHLKTNLENPHDALKILLMSSDAQIKEFSQINAEMKKELKAKSGT